MIRPGLLVAPLVLLTLASSPRAEVLVGIAAPITGPMAWGGVESVQGAERAIADLNQAGGVLGQQVQAVVVDDHCDAEQGAAAARKLVESQVVAVIGHQCSGAAIPASEIYAQAGILMISDFATHPKLTERGLGNVFRVVGRDDLQGRIAGDLLADRWADRTIAILHDGEAYGRGLAERTRQRLNERGVSEVMFEAIVPGEPDYSDVVERMVSAKVEVLYYGGYVREAALLARQVAERGHHLQIVAGDGVGSDDFALIAGPASDGTLMTMQPVPVFDNPQVAALAEGSASPQGIFAAYTAVQAWAQAAQAAGSFDLDAVEQALRSHRFDTLLGTIGFDQKGDVTGRDTFVWHIWQDGAYTPVQEPPPSN
jgi:branched-chain amino acid transport system substrate-binding protein